MATSEIAAMSSSGEIWKATATATQPQARRTRGNSTAGNPEAELLIVRGRVATCMFYGDVRAQSGLYHGGFVSYFDAIREARVFGGYGGGLSMLRSESSLKIPPCSFVDFLVS